jgi:hypothetical protein
VAAELHGVGADAADAEDEQRLARLQARDADERVIWRGHGVGQHGEDGRIDRRRRADQRVRRPDDVLGERAVDVHAHPGQRGIEVLATGA